MLEQRRGEFLQEVKSCSLR